MSCPFKPNKNWVVCMIPEGKGKANKLTLVGTKSQDEKAQEQARKDYIVSGGEMIVLEVGGNVEEYVEGDVVFAGHNAHQIVFKDPDSEDVYIFFRELDILCKKK